MKLVFISLFLPKDLFLKACAMCLLLCAVFPFITYAGAVMDVQELSELPVVVESPSADTAATPAFGAWPDPASSSQKEDKIWQEGISDQDLLREKMFTTVKKQDKTTPSMGPEQTATSAHASEDAGVTLGGGTIHGDAEVMGNSWSAPGSQEPIIDEDMMHRQYDVVGAYGQMVDGEDFKMSVGPELYIPGEGADVLGKDGNDTSELGMSMKFKWGF